MHKDIKNKTLKGVIWISLQRFSMILTNLVSNIVLARLLTPDDFGCVAMLMIFISLANTLIDGGFGAALIQKQKASLLDYSTIFYFNIFLSIVLYLLLFVTSHSIAEFYQTPLLSSVLKVQGLVLIFNAFSIVQQNILKKQLQFKIISLVHIISSIISLGIAVILALKGYGVWSLVYQQLAMALLMAILLWILCKWRPLLAFSINSFKELFGFGSFMLLSSLFNALSTEIQGLLVGRKFNSYTLGLYNQAYRLEGSAATLISSLMHQVTLPVLSSLQDAQHDFISALKRFIQLPAYISSLIMMVLIVIARPLIIILYTENWVDAIPYFQILCTAGLAVSLQETANSALAAIGKSKVLFYWTIIKRSLTIILCLAGIVIAGMKGLLWMCVAGSWSVYFVNSYLISKYIGYSFIRQFLDILPSIVLAVFVGFVVVFCTRFLTVNLYLEAFIKVCTCCLLYIFISKAFRFNAYQYIHDIIKENINRLFLYINKKNGVD